MTRCKKQEMGFIWVMKGDRSIINTYKHIYEFQDPKTEKNKHQNNSCTYVIMSNADVKSTN